MLPLRTVMITASTVMAFGAGWLAKTNAQQKAPAPLITYFSHERVDCVVCAGPRHNRQQGLVHA